MWCDDFDMDLPKVLPAAMQVIAPVADVRMWTRGHATGGSLNHPSVWNGYESMDAFFTLHEGVDPVKPPYVTSNSIVACTFDEAVRDCWVHDYALRVDGVVVWNTTHYFNQLFGPLMYDVRKWKPLSAERRRAIEQRVLYDLETAVEWMRVAMNLSREAVGRT